jgi:hypothetical protein
MHFFRTLVISYWHLRLLGVALCGCLFCSHCDAPQSDFSVARLQIHKTLKFGAAHGCETENPNRYGNESNKIEKWLVEEFDETQDEVTEYNALVLLDCFSHSKYNGLFMKKLRGLSMGNSTRAYRIFRNLNRHNAMETDLDLRVFMVETDFALLRESAIYCVRIADKSCEHHLRKIIIKYGNDKSSIASQQKARKLESILSNAKP